MSCNCPFKHPEQEDMAKLNSYNWDITLGKEHKPMRVYRLEGCIHTKGGKHGINDMYVADRNIPKEEIKPSDLTEYSGEICWGFNVQQRNYYRKDELRCGCHADIYCAGRKVYQINCSFEYIASKVMDTILKLKEDSPISFGEINFEKDVIGRKIWWRDQPAIITSYSVEDGEVLIRPIGSDTFKLLNKDKKGEDWVKEYSTESLIKDDILSPSIYWFRDETADDLLYKISETIIFGIAGALKNVAKTKITSVKMRKVNTVDTPNLTLIVDDEKNLLRGRYLDTGVKLEYIEEKKIDIDKLITEVNKKLNYLD